MVGKAEGAECGNVTQCVQTQYHLNCSKCAVDQKKGQICGFRTNHRNRHIGFPQLSYFYRLSHSTKLFPRNDLIVKGGCGGLRDYIADFPQDILPKNEARKVKICSKVTRLYISNVS